MLEITVNDTETGKITQHVVGPGKFGIFLPDGWEVRSQKIKRRKSLVVVTLGPEQPVQTFRRENPAAGNLEFD